MDINDGQCAFPTAVYFLAVRTSLKETKHFMHILHNTFVRNIQPNYVLKLRD